MKYWRNKQNSIIIVKNTSFCENVYTYTLKIAILSKTYQYSESLKSLENSQINNNKNSTKILFEYA